MQRILKLEQSGVKFATPTVNKINALPESPNEVAERMMMIERLGGVLKYSDVPTGYSVAIF